MAQKSPPHIQTNTIKRGQSYLIQQVAPRVSSLERRRPELMPAALQAIDTKLITRHPRRMRSIQTPISFVSRIAAAIGITLVMSPGGAFALDCKNAVTTLDLNECADLDYKAADRRLNEAYRQALARIDKSGLPPEGLRAYRQALQDTQRKWIPFRDAECELARFEAYGGTMATMIGIGCLTNQTERRVKDLQGISASE